MSRPDAAVLLTGNELLRGVIADRNAAHLAERLERLGLRMARVLVVGDGRPTSRPACESWPAAATWWSRPAGSGPRMTIAPSRRWPPWPACRSVVDEDVLGRITAWTDADAARSGTDPARFEAGNRKQAHIPRGARCWGWRAPLRGWCSRWATGAWWCCRACRPSFGGCGRCPRPPALAGLFAGAHAARALADPHLRHQRVTRRRPVRRGRAATRPASRRSICARNYEIEIDIRADRRRRCRRPSAVERLRALLGGHVFATDEQPLAEIVLDLAAGAA